MKLSEERKLHQIRTHSLVIVDNADGLRITLESLKSFLSEMGSVKTLARVESLVGEYCIHKDGLGKYTDSRMTTEFKQFKRG